MTRIAIFDLDGTLVDSDDALAAPFVAHGVPRDQVTFGHVLADECARLGISVDAYLDLYDDALVLPFAGVDELLDGLEHWAVCSNKHAEVGHAELARFGWRPDVALFSDAFGGPKRLQPVLDLLGLAPHEVVFIGDTSHDRRVATEVGATFGLAGWNRRAEGAAGDVVLESPADVAALLAQ
jgi:HAD superfamily hydrolase (TIGR01549 family)